MQAGSLGTHTGSSKVSATSRNIESRMKHRNTLNVVPPRALSNLHVYVYVIMETIDQKEKAATVVIENHLTQTVRETIQSRNHRVITCVRNTS